MKISKKRLKRIVLEEYAKLHGLKLKRKAPTKRSGKLKESKKYTRRELLEIKKLTARLKKLIK